MTNHVHLLLTPDTAEACAMLMKNVGQRYVQTVNRRLDRSGTLWEGRFKSCLVPSESYVLACYRYIELNPVRAGMVRMPEQYRWSSYAANTGRRTGFLVPHPAYAALGMDVPQRIDAYRRLCEDAPSEQVYEEIRKATRAGCAVGTKRRRRGRPWAAK
jgi:putative transposase